MWILKALAEFKESGRSPRLLQDFEDGYYKTLRLPIHTSGTRCSGYHMTVGSKSGEGWPTKKIFHFKSSKRARKT